MEFSHKSVLLNETIEMLAVEADGIYVDGTAGGAGHSSEIVKKLTNGKLYALDQDPDAIKVATERLAGLNAEVIKTNFRYMKDVMNQRGIEAVDGILLDLGVSSWQLDNRSRGFSYHDDAPLDMRMSQEGKTAADLVNCLSVDELTKIFRDFGEEKFAYKIALNIVEYRKKEKILTTKQLVEIISQSIPAKFKRDGHPARKCFQALRIAVNEELDLLPEALNTAFDLLKPGGVLAVITFHSLEDRITKQTFSEFCKGCVCPPDFPICVCGRKPKGELVNRKPIIAGEKELEENQRSRSAKLRGIRKLERNAEIG